MLARLRSRLSYSNVTATIALVLAAGTGGAYAANTIGSDDVINDSLLGEDVKQGTLKAGDLAANTVSSSRILDETLVGQDVKNDSLTGDDISEQSLDLPLADALSNAVGQFQGTFTQTGARRTSTSAGQTAPFDVPDFGVLTGRCNVRGLNFSYENKTSFGFQAWMDAGGGDPVHKQLAPMAPGDADTIASGGNDGVDTVGEAITLRVDSGPRVLTIWAFGSRSSSDGNCDFSFQALWARG
jgi:hypothetical protein